MKDAFGGILNIVFVAIFLVIVSGILGMIVNYNKAFQMKNIVITAIEQYEGSRGCFSESGISDSACRQRIIEGAESIGYSPVDLNCHGYKSSDNLFCYEKRDSDSHNHDIFTIVTQVDIDIPIINKIMGLEIFQVHGDTKALIKRNDNY